MTTRDLTIRPFQEGDAEAAFELGANLGLSQWTVDDYKEELARADSAMLTAVRLSEVVGFIIGRRVPGTIHSGTDAEIYNIGVAARFQRSGIGSRLLLEFLDQCSRAGVRDVWLDVRSTNVSAIRFYQRFHFVAYAVRPGFYRDPPDGGVLMRLNLS